MKEIQGIAAARGFALGPAFQLRPLNLEVKRRTVQTPGPELDRLEQAMSAAALQVEEVHQKAAAELSAKEASIFEAHLLMLQDPELRDAMRKSIQEQCVNAKSAVEEATEHYARILEKMDSDYFRARAADVRDIARRLIRLLLNPESTGMHSACTPSIVIARDLMPSDTVLLDKRLVLGFCTVEGSETSHTAILARALGIPAIVACPDEVLGIPDGTVLILDGPAGRLYIEPTQAETNRYRTRKASWTASSEDALAQCHEPAVTLDGHRVEVLANIGSVPSANAAVEKGAEGVGLLRTEFIYMERGTLPDESEQTEVYSAILGVFESLPVTLRTSDIGGDKVLPYFDLPDEANPFLGVRGLRLALLHRDDLLKPQLKAAFRAGKGHDLRVMFPMVATLAEIRQARTVLEECRAELHEQGILIPEKLQVGIMIEVPSAAIMADAFAPMVDFFSIGTNDLAQYTLAADRNNSHLAYLASAFSPAVLRLIQNVILQAHKYGRKVAVCGELAGEPLAIPILLGLGLDEFSMNPQAIPAAKQIVRSVKVADCQQLAEQVLKLESIDEVKHYVGNRMPGIASS